MEPLICRQHRGEEDRQHLRNAAQLLVDNAMTDWEVLGVERPFVLPLGRGLPPCIGVVDLIVRKDGVIAIIDHKTGKTVGGGDPMQLAVYRQFVIRRHEAKEYLTRFDEYRWVNNLGRIRKPAFQRTEVALGPTDWASALDRFREANRRIRRIEEDRDAAGNGQCYMCPYRGVCKKASYATSW
jgi:CRISPR/Cas system-associated exonuclease Cas4 (RecB family)